MGIRLNIDWAGQVVEGITGKRLGTVMEERIFTPLGMGDTGFSLTPGCAPGLPPSTNAKPTAPLPPFPTSTAA